MFEIFTKPYCEVTFLDSLVLLLALSPIFLIVFLIIYKSNNK